MIKWIRFRLARFLQTCMLKKFNGKTCTEADARKFNILSGIVITKGRILFPFEKKLRHRYA